MIASTQMNFASEARPSQYIVPFGNTEPSRLTGWFLLLQNFSVAISVRPHVCFILVLILISMFPR